MRRQTTALALAGTLLVAPAVAYAADPLEVPLAGHPSVADQMRAYGIACAKAALEAAAKEAERPGHPWGDYAAAAIRALRC